ncbi:hypothetical protein I2I11_20425 [Pontibacter sp. 172403-2]|uniref:hypothetical protein n=1 Tax=Pontibacter rufus TaxID=2791028 RepID=UPI0018AFDE6F|nr:hypothetical protein [Pontibacter sp. 172403-2]MBF9255675.1 hypothetical protein [Pontibacter sp. 172403-2]
MNMTKSAILLLVIASFGCSRKVPLGTYSGEKIVMIQRNVSLYRNKPHIWPAKGRVIATNDNLLFVPTPYFGMINIHGRDTTIIRMDKIKRLRPKRWMLLFPFGLEVTTDGGKSYAYVTVRRKKLVQEILRIKE